LVKAEGKWLEAAVHVSQIPSGNWDEPCAEPVACRPLANYGILIQLDELVPA